eukprot:UN34274
MKGWIFVFHFRLWQISIIISAIHAHVIITVLAPYKHFIWILINMSDLVITLLTNMVFSIFCLQVLDHASLNLHWLCAVWAFNDLICASLHIFCLLKFRVLILR